MSVSEWADENRVLSAVSSSMPGKWRTSHAEYLRGIMNAVDEQGISEIYIMSASQLGKSEVLLNIIGRHIDLDPCPILFVQPTIKNAEEFSKDRVAPMINLCPAIRRKVSEAKSRDSDNTILKKIFPGGYLSITGSNSPSDLSSKPIRITLYDEVDRYEVTSEGDAIGLGDARQKTFYNRKSVKVSSPSVSGNSRIEKGFNQGDQRYFFVPCPYCNKEQRIEFQNIRWEKDHPEKAHLVCIECGGKITEQQKKLMIKKGKWIPTAEGDGTTASFHISTLYSPFETWAACATRFLKVKDDPDQLRVFKNTVLGELWEETRGKRPELEDWGVKTEVYDPAFEVPTPVLFLTAGVDIQGNRIEVEVVGWGPGEESWSVDYRIVMGSPQMQETWDQLDDYLFRPFSHKYGPMTIKCCCIDSGYCTKEVYSFTSARKVRHIFAIKGMAGENKPPVGRPSQANNGKTTLYTLGVDSLKTTFYGYLTRDVPGAGYCHFPDRYDKEHFLQLTCEQVIEKLVNGQKQRVWIADRKRNETLDCRIYAMAAMLIMRPEWDAIKRRRAEAEGQDVPEKSAKAKPYKLKNWLNSWRK